MKRNTLLVPVVLLMFLLIAACSKKNAEKRDKYLGNYKRLTGTAKFVFDAFGQYNEHFGPDTASVIITKADSTDIYLQGVVEDPSYNAFRFGSNSEYLILAHVVDTGFIIPNQIPISGYGKSVEGSGAIKNGKLVLTYTTSYRGYYKYSTVTQN